MDAPVLFDCGMQAWHTFVLYLSVCEDCNMSTAPKGFRFATACAGFRKEGRADLALLVSDVPAVAAGTFTQNRFPAAPVLVAKAMLAERPAARAVVINSGQANACTGDEGMRNCRTTQELVAGALLRRRISCPRPRALSARSSRWIFGRRPPPPSPPTSARRPRRILLGRS